jgi:RNA recognition motif-containing protein
LSVDYKWHMVGPNRGRPRGFAFVEFGSEEDAAKAVRSTSDMIVRGRRLTVRLSDRNASAEGSNNRGGSVDKSATGSAFINRESPSSLGASLKRGRAEGGTLDLHGSGNDKKSRTVRSIDEQMRRIRETLSKIESESSK